MKILRNAFVSFLFWGGCFNVYAVEIDQLIEAAGMGSKVATYSLGVRYANADGVKKDQDKANLLYRRAARMNYSPAQNNLGWSYRLGLGVKKSPMTAFYWFRLAALQNNALALQNLAEMYQLGEGVTADDKLAQTLYTLCATLPVINTESQRESGFNNAILECRRELGKSMLIGVKDDQEKLRLAAFWINLSLVQNEETKEDSEIGLRARRTVAETREMLEEIKKKLSQESIQWIDKNTKNWDVFRVYINDTTSFPFTELDCGNYKDS